MTYIKNTWLVFSFWMRVTLAELCTGVQYLWYEHSSDDDVIPLEFLAIQQKKVGVVQCEVSRSMTLWGGSLV